MICARARLAYSLENASWPGSTLQVRIQLGPSNIVLRDGSVSWDKVAENAFAVWNEQMARLKVGWTVAPPNTPASSRDGVTEIQFGSTVYGDSFGSNISGGHVGFIQRRADARVRCDL